jgi:hypothetical protein
MSTPEIEMPSNCPSCGPPLDKHDGLKEYGSGSLSCPRCGAYFNARDRKWRRDLTRLGAWPFRSSPRADLIVALAAVCSEAQAREIVDALDTYLNEGDPTPRTPVLEYLRSDPIAERDAAIARAEKAEQELRSAHAVLARGKVSRKRTRKAG